METPGEPISPILLSITKVHHGSNVKNGKSIIYHPNGNIKQKTHFVNDRPHGWHKEYHENGQLKVKTRFNMGQQATNPEYWDPTGSKL